MTPHLSFFSLVFSIVIKKNESSSSESVLDLTTLSFPLGFQRPVDSRFSSDHVAPLVRLLS